MKFTLSAVCAIILAATTPAQAVTVTNLVTTPNSLSFNFSGSGVGDFLSHNAQLQALAQTWNFWGIGEAQAINNLNGTYAFLFRVSHDNGPLAELGSGNIATPIGSPLNDSESLAHFGALDQYSFSVTVQSGFVFSGTFSAVHTTPTAGVSDGGSGFLLTSIALLSLVGFRRRMNSA